LLSDKPLLSTDCFRMPDLKSSLNEVHLKIHHALKETSYLTDKGSVTGFGGIATTIGNYLSDPIPPWPDGFASLSSHPSGFALQTRLGGEADVYLMAEGGWSQSWRFNWLNRKQRRRIGREENHVSSPPCPTTFGCRSTLAHGGSGASSGNGWEIAGALQVGQAQRPPRAQFLQWHKSH